MARERASRGVESFKMGDRWQHRLIGFIFYVSLVICLVIMSALKAQGIYDFPITVGIADISWLVMGFGLCMFGAEIPDYDQYERGSFHIFGGRPHLLQHRSGLTHSPIFPFFFFVLVAFLAVGEVVVVASILLTSFLVGHASHLFLDIFPSKDADKPPNNNSYNKYCLHFVSGSRPKRIGTIICLVAFGLFEIGILGVWALKLIPSLPFGWP